MSPEIPLHTCGCAGTNQEAPLTCLGVITLQNLTLTDTPETVGTTDLCTVDTEKKLLNRQWELFLSILSTAKPHLREVDPLQLTRLLHGGSAGLLSPAGQGPPGLSESAHLLWVLWPLQKCQ